MMDWTDRHCRFFHRQISRHTVLYTEMVTTDAVLRGDRERLLAFDPAEHPVALQLGGCDPDKLREAALLGEHWGYDEINLNVGCPSDRVQQGRFGVCLMKEPDLVADSVAAMIQAVELPVTVKTRIGVDDQDSFEFLQRFVTAVADAGCKTFIIHARKAWLKGLSPKQNREVPPLNYQRVYELKDRYPELEIILNGGVTNLDQAEAHLKHVNGVMFGRAAYHDAFLLSTVDGRFYGDEQPAKTRTEVVTAMVAYIDHQKKQQVRVNHISRHMLSLFQGQPGARKWRRYISENAHQTDSGTGLLGPALELVQKSRDAKNVYS